MKRPARAPLPLVTWCFVLAMLAVYGIDRAGDGLALCERLGFVASRPSLENALTSLLVHDPRGFAHVGGNLVVLVLVGSRVEQAIGSTRLAGLFLAGAALHVVVDPTSTIPLVGASGALFSVLAVAADIYGPAMLAFVAVLVVTNIAHAFTGGGGVLSFGAHLGGFAFGVLVVALARLRGIDLFRRPRAVAA